VGKTNYTFRHFVLDEWGKKLIDPSQVNVIKDQCKLLLANMVTGKEHDLVKR